MIDDDDISLTYGCSVGSLIIANDDVCLTYRCSVV